MKKQLLRLLKINAHGWYSATIGPSSPHLDKLKDRVRNPRIGDLVLEITTFHQDLDDATNIGRLVAIEQWPCGTPEDFECAVEDVPTKKVWVLELCFDDNRQYTWENAMFIAIPETEESFQ